MNKIVAMIVLMIMATPALGKACQTSPSKGLQSHYRLIEGKKCWYQGSKMAKAELSWGKSNVVANRSSPSNAPVRVAARPSADQALPVAPRVIADWTLDIRGMATPLSKTLVLVSAIEQEATDFAIDAMCGEVTWGACERSKRYGP